MSTTIAGLIASLDRLAPLAKAAGWDPVGLQLGDPAAPAARVAVCHEVTDGVVAAVEAEPVDLLVAYHPLLFRPTTRLVAGPGAVGRAYRLVRIGAALAIVHTAFDVAAGGAADALADAVGLSAIEPFGPSWGPEAVKIVTYVPASHIDAATTAMTAAGAGEIGNYSGCSFRTAGTGTFFAGPGTDPATGSAGSFNAEAETRIEMVAPARAVAGVVAALVASHPYEEPAFDVYDVRANPGFIGRAGRLPAAEPLAHFADRVAELLGGVCRVAGDRRTEVQTVAVIPGSGGDFFGSLGAVDVVVTGDVSHHRAREAMERGVAVVDPGHAATERPGVARLYAAVATLVDDPIDLTGVDADPWRG